MLFSSVSESDMINKLFNCLGVDVSFLLELICLFEDVDEVLLFEEPLDFCFLTFWIGEQVSLVEESGLLLLCSEDLLLFTLEYISLSNTFTLPASRSFQKEFLKLDGYGEELSSESNCSSRPSIVS